ncbi:hypothetical protein R0G64_23320, partial [Pseudomonas otitidis]|nr:hypothetical protein [Pseudomonas otitidis]
MRQHPRHARQAGDETFEARGFEVVTFRLGRVQGTSKNVGEAASARQKQAKKRSLRGVNEHFEPVFNAAMA